ncbi:MAG: DNA-directed RNA polymerase subunit omega [Actinomycetota bacterium]|nr:DNA-directed RNA polymerase subunit omega [Actinomycetota bacterium]
MSLPNIDELIDKVDSKYTLCIEMAKRTRELADYFQAKKNMERTNIIEPLIETNSIDPLEIAFNEIKEGKIDYVRVKDGIK